MSSIEASGRGGTVVQHIKAVGGVEDVVQGLCYRAGPTQLPITVSINPTIAI